MEGGIEVYNYGIYKEEDSGVERIILGFKNVGNEGLGGYRLS